MAKIIGAIASSHSPVIGFAHDRQKATDPIWGPIFEAYVPIRKWLDEKKPDVMFLICNDHVTSFFFDHYSHFALGIGAEFEPADEGGGQRDIPSIKNHMGLAHHIASSFTADEFDMSFLQQRNLDHGVFSPLSMIMPHDPDWPAKVIPFQVGVLQFPIPSARRCYKLGTSLRKAIESYPEDLKVVIIATGGLSHQVHGERCGFNNVEWDEQFMELFENDPERLASMTIAEYAELGGMEGSEVIMWLIMRGAMSASMKKIHQTYYLPTMTGLATAIYENQATDPTPEAVTEYRQHVAHQLDGVEKLEGTYPFTLERSVRGYRINKFLHQLTGPEHRRRFREEEEALLAESNLSEEEKQLIRTRNWRGMMHYGAIFFLLEKMAAVVGTSNPHVYAHMRGQTLDDFQKTRTHKVLYSVAGKDSGKLAWEKDQPTAAAAK
jgi:gallate dioxygenase